MSKVEKQSFVFFAEREFTCWRERECNDVYPCQISSQGSNGVTLKLDDTTIRFAKGVAQEISHCLKDAFLVNLGNEVNVLFTSRKRKSKLERKFRKDVSGRWNYMADGRFKCQQKENEIYFMKFSKAPVETMEELGVYTVEEGGIELVLESMCYSFGMQDAFWLAESLLAATHFE
ncbi:hypothetical protein PS928_05563 [Pseudomonas fluorescens]|uniref:Uncharacterized protein n=1 Tax=Pseudomonas fluorescens TaxID=294 RepID=A0A5E7VLE4_PSEFL|nr:hypothetical protein PS928_05563 [Pseudomonas fluorescens]